MAQDKGSGVELFCSVWSRKDLGPIHIVPLRTSTDGGVRRVNDQVRVDRPVNTLYLI